MPAVTQIVPEYSFPYVESYITDYTEVTEDTPSTVASDPGVGFIYAFASDRGIDNRWVLKRTQQAFVKTFGTPNFKKYGQPNLTPYVLLGEGGTKVWCMRCMPENATRAHAIVSLYYKADGEDVAVGKRKFRIKYTSRFVDPAKNSQTRSSAKLIWKKFVENWMEKQLAAFTKMVKDIPRFLAFSSSLLMDEEKEETLSLYVLPTLYPMKKNTESRL